MLLLFDGDAVYAPPWSLQQNADVLRCSPVLPINTMMDEASCFSQSPYMHLNHWPGSCSTTGHMDLWAEGRRQDQHRCVSSQLRSQLPCLTSEGKGQLHTQSPKSGQSLHPDNQCKNERWGEVHLRIRYLPQWQRTGHHLSGHAGYVTNLI